MGTLFLVSTPIGNLEDVTLRALRILGEVDVVAAEDTRQTRKLLDRYDIDTPLISYHDHSEAVKLKVMLDHLSKGSVALVSDAGTPLVSDPGFKLVRAAASAGHEISPIPGPSAPIAALTVSGLPTDSFIFLGWFPRKANQRKNLFGELSKERRTMVAMEAPHRLREALQDLETEFGPERQIAVCRELTKKFEEVVRGTLSDVREHFDREEPRGEITLVLGGGDWASEWDEASVREVVSRRISEGMRRSEAARQVAAETGWPRREVYRLAEETE